MSFLRSSWSSRTTLRERGTACQRVRRLRPERQGEQMVILDRTKTYTATDISVIENKMLSGILACRDTGGGGVSDHLRALPQQDGAHGRELPAVHQGAGDREPLGHRRAHRRARPLPLLQLHPAQLPAADRVVQPPGGAHPGGLYAKSLSVVLGILQAAYNVPVDGYKIYSLTVSDLNALGKHLDEEAGPGRLPEPLHPRHPGKGGAAGRPGRDQPRHGRGCHPRQRDPQLLLRHARST